VDSVEFGEKNRAYISDFIKFADTKAGAIIALTAAICSLFGANATNIVAATKAAPLWLAVAAGIGGAVTLLSALLTVWFALKAITPDTGRTTASLASFPDIAALTEDAHCEQLAGLDEAGLIHNYALVNGRMARIACSKYEFIATAMTWMRLLLIASWGILVISIVETLAA
jgi:Family of unknown function (DUF5706)